MDYMKLLESTKEAFNYEMNTSYNQENNQVIEVFGFEILEPQDKEKILEHLKNSQEIGIAGNLPPVDKKSGEFVNLQLEMRTDGVFKWTTYDMYFFKNYDVKLSEEFKKHVLDLDTYNKQKMVIKND